jgi:peptidyl-prolyl cis-trans isomerase SurA
LPGNAQKDAGAPVRQDIQIAMTRTVRLPSPIRRPLIGQSALVLGLAAMVAGPIASSASAQAVRESADANGALNIPANPTLFGKSDPNVRRATAIVNGEIVTGTDVEQRLALIVNANGGKVGPEEMDRLRLQVLRNLIDETLQIQEAKAADIQIGDDEVNQTFERVATQNFGQSVPALEKYLASIGSSAASLKRQIKGELSWQRLLRRNVQPFINISDGEVREMMERLQASKGTEEYRIGEIFLSATPETQQQVRANAKRSSSRSSRAAASWPMRASFRSLDRGGRRRSGLDPPRPVAHRTGRGRAAWPRASLPARSRFPAASRSCT